MAHGSYKNQLLTLAKDLGRRFLPAFNTPTGLPFAWINLKVSQYVGLTYFYIYVLCFDYYVKLLKQNKM